jgi:macrodomain Ter protein organizer (MatP/YcbG family)
MSSRKSRKSLDDALAQQFIYGEVPDEPNRGQKTASGQSTAEFEHRVKSRARAKKKSVEEPGLAEKFSVSSKEATVRFTVDLSVSMHRKLSVLAAKLGKKKAEIVRVLLAEALEDIEDTGG